MELYVRVHTKYFLKKFRTKPFSTPEERITPKQTATSASNFLARREAAQKSKSIIVPENDSTLEILTKYLYVYMCNIVKDCMLYAQPIPATDSCMCLGWIRRCWDSEETPREATGRPEVASQRGKSMVLGKSGVEQYIHGQELHLSLPHLALHGHQIRSSQRNWPS